MTHENSPHTGHIRGERAGDHTMDNPLDVIAEDHMREREVCALIEGFVSGTALSGSDLEMMTRFLWTELPKHLEDEEEDLFPLLLKRCAPEDEIGKVVEKLLSDHEHAFNDGTGIGSLLESHCHAPERLSARERAQLTDFANHARRHLILENAVVLPIARVRLTSDDLQGMWQRMQARRGGSISSEGRTC
ncbi:hemerythrin domain-containing protein [Sulfitobacter sp. JB4-11]|uniref:hemerythrin domain-containing protein n=1 Tax=Sulfitobacter rhodophyticola TaxID=3238304 RepID=UPI0035194757